MAAAAKIKVSDVAKRMGKSEKDLIFQLQSLGAEITDANQVLEPEVIQALITGKKLVTRTRSVIMREDKPLPEKKKEAVRPPRPIVQPPVRKKVEAPKEEPTVAPPPTVIIPEFQEAAEAEERAAKEAPVEKPKVEKPKKVQEPAPEPVVAEASAATEAPSAAPEAPAPPPAAPHHPHPARPAAHAPSAPSGVDRRPTGPTGPRARAPQGPRPNYAGQQTMPTGRPTGAPQSPRPSGPGSPMNTRPGGNAPMGSRPSGPGGPRPSGPGGPMGQRPMGSGPGGPMGQRPMGGPGGRPGGPMGARPSGPGGMRGPGGGQNFRPGSGRPPLQTPPPSIPGPNIIRRKKEDDARPDDHEKKKTAKRGAKTVRGGEFDQDLLTKGPFSGTQIINDDIGPDIVLPDLEEAGEGAKRASSRRDARKQANPHAKVLDFKKPTGKVALTEGVTVKELAEKLDIKASDLLKHLFMKKGLMVSINQPLGGDLALEVASELKIDAEIVSFEEAVEMEAMVRSESAGGTMPRGPVITVMGHVDHGKTSLLDAIRETNVAGGEAGGITQHIGAYHVEKRGRKIVFLDTPGHEAFTMMRARGAKVTDIVILVVAADDGVMPQTKEAIDHARAAKVPMIVAINKIDKPNANVERVRRELADANVLVEQWGGEVVSVEVSAVKKQGIDDLLDMILLTADILDLKANPDMPAKGVVLEARKEVGRGTVGTVLIQDGTLKVGDPFFSGTTWGRVRAMSDERGKRISEAGPATPVQLSGFEDVPNAGDSIAVVDDDTQARMIGQLRQEKARENAQQKVGRMSLDQLFQRMQTGGVKELNLIVKADVQGSVEVLRDTLIKLSTSEVKVNVIHASVGAVSTNDVMLATASDAIVIGFNVRPERNASELADKEGVDIRSYTVIYSLVDEMRLAMTGLLDPKFQEVFQGRAQVRDTFKVPKVGTIAGCMVTEGIIPRTAGIRLLRDNRVILEGKISSLRHFKNDVAEVRQGFECGIGIEKFQDMKVGDVIEAFKIEKLEATLSLT
ncbi:MAG TPA: translation initiation factor IF-2 [Thermoanaerobaculia bacterium]|jgi:translation initiation factor IF-2|nr:translation initiation factor IF-2 [Thermoanaerobaculia bacterium]